MSGLIPGPSITSHVALKTQFFWQKNIKKAQWKIVSGFWVAKIDIESAGAIACFCRPPRPDMLKAGLNLLIWVLSINTLLEWIYRINKKDKEKLYGMEENHETYRLLQE